MNSLPFQNIDDLQDSLSENLRINFDQFSKNNFSVSSFTYENVDKRNEIDSFDEQLLYNLQETLPDCHYYDAEQFNNLEINSSFSFISCNINSFSCNFDSFYSTFLNNNKFSPDLLGLCETRLNNDLEPLFSIPKFNLIFNSRNTRGGGLILAINENLKYKKLENYLFYVRFY